MSYAADRLWAETYTSEVRRIVGQHLVGIADATVDQMEATDLVILQCEKAVAMRIRRPGYKNRFPYDFTIRSRRDSGAETELAKLRQGHAHWMFYGHAGDNDETGISRWMLLNLDVWRDNPQIGSSGDIPNGDGTYFQAFDVRKYPDEILIASSHPCLFNQNRRSFLRRREMIGNVAADRFVAEGTWDIACPRCGSREWVDVVVQSPWVRVVDADMTTERQVEVPSRNTIRRDCKKCEFFLAWSRWLGCDDTEDNMKKLIRCNQVIRAALSKDCPCPK